jgi:hypothetical protein
MDLSNGVSTHHADSYLKARLPETGNYYVKLTDRAHKGGKEYFYRLRVGAPQPDFELHVVPSSLAIRYNSNATATVYVLRKDDYDGPIRIGLLDAPDGFSALPVMIPRGQTVGKLVIKAPAKATREPVRLQLAGSATVDGKNLVHKAIAGEDKMQAFLWRHLVPAGGLMVTVFDPSASVPFRRPLPVAPPKARLAQAAPVPATAVVAATNSTAAPTAVDQNGTMMGEDLMMQAGSQPGLSPATGSSVARTPSSAKAAPAPTVTPAVTEPPKPKFTKQQVAGRLRQLRILYEARLLTDSFYLKKVEECKAAQ